MLVLKAYASIKGCDTNMPRRSLISALDDCAHKVGTQIQTQIKFSAASPINDLCMQILKNYFACVKNYKI